ncbi:MAG: hypothetical protein FWG84_01335 [Bacteroidales bacterium]|nr:hypothetical protein [Bacteroidales bacterium]
MKTVKILMLVVTLTIVCNSANAQFGRNAVQRGIERAVEKKAEEKAEEVASDAIDKAFENAEEERRKGEAEAERGLNAAAEAIEDAQRNQEEADAQVAAMPDKIPEVSNTPYTPSEGEFAFFAMKQGAVQEFVTKDAKGKITDQTRNTITAITGDKNAFAIAYQSEILDAKGQPANKDNPLILNFRVMVKDGLLYLDMNGMFGAIEGIDNMQASGTAMKIPSNLSVGQRLDDASAKVKIGFINCSAVMTEIECVAVEDVTVEAGTFRACKVSQKVNAAAMGIQRLTRKSCGEGGGGHA